MEEIRVWGLSASSGKAIGRVFRKAAIGGALDESRGHSANEKNRLYRAIGEVKAELFSLADETKRRVGEEEGEIFLIHALFLEDEDLLGVANEALELTHTAEYAAISARNFGAAALLATNDEVMRARADDLYDVFGRVLMRLSGEQEESFPREPFLYVARSITPSAVLSLSKSDCVGIVIEEGATESHAAILAGAISLPMLVGCKGETLVSDQLAYLDADGGFVSQPPREEDLLACQQYNSEKRKREGELLRYRDLSFRYPSGKRLTVGANVGSLFEWERACALGAEGIGLFRSELLFLDSPSMPSEAEQFSLYRALVEGAKPHTAVLRILDVGADKIPSWLTLGEEKNPALGLRGIRLIGKYPEIFNTQLRAMLKASAYGNAVILLPMVTSREEILRAKARLQTLTDALRKAGERVGDYRLGVMIETPAAALDAASLAEEVDYFSIGTNDLYQYTMAIDRENHEALAEVKGSLVPLQKLIDGVLRVAREKGVTVSLCGALAGDREMAKWLVAQKIDSLSVSLSAILETKRLCAQCLENNQNFTD